MSFGKYSRMKSRKSSLNYCSKVNSVVLLAFCLVGLWMMISLSNVPVRNVGVSSQKNKSEMEVQINNEIDFPKIATKGDSNLSLSHGENNSSSQEKSKVLETTTENAIEEKPGKKPVKGSLEEETKSEDASKTEMENAEVKIKEKKPKTEKKDTPEEGMSDNKSSLGEGKDSNQSLSETKGVDKMDSHIENKVTQDQDKETEQISSGKKEDKILNEGRTWNWTQRSSERVQEYVYRWKLCNVSAGPDYIPCLDNLQAIRSLQTTKHYEHRERHCPEEPPTCLLPLPEGYRHPIEWPMSRKKIWYNNVPHTKLAEVKGHQNWLKVRGDYHIFPGGGTQFRHGALHYIDFLQKSVPDIAWGKHSRVILDVGCGVASFGGYLFDKDVLTMSLAPKDEHEAQVQFALERGIPAISAVMGTKRLPFPGRVFDVVHCSRCRVPWHIEGGKLLLELNRILRPGGLFVWSATPVYQKHSEDLEIWEAMKQLTKSMCWKLVSLNRDRVNRVGVAIYRKPTSNECYDRRTQHEPPLCQESDDPNAAWNVPLQACMHKVPVNASERGSKWPEKWPERLENPPYWILSSQVGVYGKAAPEDFAADYEHWKHVVAKLYLNKMGISWSAVRNVMDMRSIYGGFAAALRDLNVWVMNVVTIDAPDTLPIIYERGLFGIYHDWCESFSTYPRSYDLLHADHLFSEIKKTKCNLVALVAEVDRILRPDGNLIVRDNVETVNELERMLKTVHWNVQLSYSKNKEGLLCAQKTTWRPKEVETLTHAIA